MKTFFLAVVIAPVPFNFIFILLVYKGQVILVLIDVQIYRMLFLALQKVLMVKITLPTTPPP